MHELTELVIDPIVVRALEEDGGRGDVTTAATIPANQPGRAVAVAKAAGVVAGLPVARRAFLLVDPGLAFSTRCGEGETVEPGRGLFEVRGRMAAILTAERVALNLLQRMSGVATLTRAFVDAIRHTRARMLDTRKTTPGLRALEKYAVRVGGGLNHRYSLGDAILIKDNHIAAAGGIRPALERARAQVSPLLKIEIECATLAQLEEALAVGCDMIMLDNMDADTMRRAVALTGGRVPLEASGNVRLATVAAVAETGVDFVSCGALTHSAPALDISLEVTGGGEA